MSTDNAGEGLREAVEALAAEWAHRAHVLDCDRACGAVEAGRLAAARKRDVAALRAALAEHPATPAEVDEDRPPTPYDPNDPDEAEFLGIDPPAEPDAGEWGGLADTLHPHLNAECDYLDAEVLAVVVMTSDWLATRVREAEQRGAERALRDAADEMAGGQHSCFRPQGCVECGRQKERDARAEWLRARADATRSES